MLFSIKPGNVLGVSSDQRGIVYLVSSTEAAYAAGLRCVFTDGTQPLRSRPSPTTQRCLSRSSIGRS
jgi:hypothetical protein